MEEFDSSVLDIFVDNSGEPPAPGEPTPAIQLEPPRRSTGPLPPIVGGVYNADTLELQTKDFILNRFSQDFNESLFTEFIEGLLNSMGYRTTLFPDGPDGGVNILASKLGLQSQNIRVQVKSPASSIADSDVATLAGKLAKKSDYGMIVNLGKFLPSAVTYVGSRKNLKLIDRDTLVKLILAQYEKLDPKHKAVIPLRRLYIQET